VIAALLLPIMESLSPTGGVLDEDGERRGEPSETPRPANVEVSVCWPSDPPAALIVSGPLLMAHITPNSGTQCRSALNDMSAIGHATCKPGQNRPT
jgi:hypothetical protein